ncbi:MAG TPA: YbaK/EbsC family protein [Candidatus Dormibacteraeota bacterium]|nr:YbaK/EbsC family protein [Candidatus Dormibacteraeota bacterium]
MSQIDEEIIAFLNQNGVTYELREHEPVYTAPQMAEYLGTSEQRIAKSMIVKKSDGGYVLAVLPGRLKIDFSRLAAILGVEKVSLAPIPEAERLARCSVGSVHPFGNLLNLKTYFDSHMLSLDFVYFNPGSHTKSIKINTDDLIRLVKPTVTAFTRTS